MINKKFYSIFSIIILFFIICFSYDRIISKFVKVMPETVNSYLAEKYMPDKFWLHRVNSVGKQEEFVNKYTGIEFDIIFYDKELAFENSHDKDNLEKYNLEKQFETYKNLNSKRGIWLDFKNLTAENKVNAKMVLDHLLEKYQIDKKLVWLESNNWKDLDIFKKDGYRTSYYFPYYKLNKMSEKEINDIKHKTQAIAESGNVDAISFYGKYYDFISAIEMPPRIHLLSWLDGYTWIEVLRKKEFEKLRNDERVKVILVKDKGKYSR